MNWSAQMINISPRSSRKVFGIVFLVVDETTLVGGLHFWRDFVNGLGSNLLVHAVVAHLTHGEGQAVVDAQGLRHGVVAEGRHHDVLTAEVTDDVGHFKMGLGSRIESILAVHLTIGVGYAFGVDLTAEVTF